MLDFSLMRLFSVIFFQSLANFPAKGLLAREGPFLKIVIFHFYL